MGARCDVSGRGLRGLVGPGKRAWLTDGDDEGEEGEAEEEVRGLHREGGREYGFWGRRERVTVEGAARQLRTTTCLGLARSLNCARLCNWAVYLAG